MHHSCDLHLKGILLGKRSLNGVGCCFSIFFPLACHMCNKMSDVRLSNASPTVERVDARPPDNVRPPVRRNLFGSPDREGLRRYFAVTIQEGVQDFMDEYNFDPVNGTPQAPGRYEWQAVSDAAEFYRRPPHGSQRPRREEDSPGERHRQDAEESERQPDPQPARGGSRKRRSVASGSCSSECPSKRSHSDEEEDDDDEEDQSAGRASQAVKAAEERPSRPENIAEVQ